jgi:hypothetical protein
MMLATQNQRKRDLWNLLEDYVERATQVFAKASTETSIQKLEKHWLNPKGGVIARLAKKPALSEAKPTARRLFLDTLSNHVRNLGRYARIWL